MNITEYMKIAIALLVVINPLGNTPLYLSLTSEETPEGRGKVSRIVSITVATVLIVSVFFGESILRFFSISMDAFKVGAGILIMMIALAMLHGALSRSKHTKEEAEEAEEKESVAVVPLGIPIMAGPGAISTAIIYANQEPQITHKAIMVGVIICIAVIIWIILEMSAVIGRVLGRTGINIATRIMGMILAAVAVEFIVAGLKVLLPGLE